MVTRAVFHGSAATPDRTGLFAVAGQRGGIWIAGVVYGVPGW